MNQNNIVSIKDLNLKEAEALLLKSIATLTDSEFHRTIKLSDISAKETSFTLNKLVFEVETRDYDWVSQPNSKSEKLPTIDKADVSKSISEWDLSEVNWNTRLAKGGTLLLDKYKLSINCSYCNGDGSTICHTCGGVSIKRCYTCEGHGRHNCYSCDGGRSRQYCRICNGTGQLKIGFGTPQEYTNCHSCYGSGFPPCKSCGDQRLVSCNNCYGRGQITCSSCNGKERVTCSECKGHKSILWTLRITSKIDSTSIDVGTKPNSNLIDVITKYEDSIKEVSNTENYTLESLKQDSSIWPILDKSLIANLESQEKRHTITSNQEYYWITSIEFSYSSKENPVPVSEMFIINKNGVILQHNNEIKNHYSLGLIRKMLSIINYEYKKKYNNKMNNAEFSNEYLAYIQSNINNNSMVDIIRNGDSSWKRSKLNTNSLFSLVAVVGGGYIAAQILAEIEMYFIFILLLVLLFLSIFIILSTIIRKNDEEISVIVENLDREKRFSDIYAYFITE
jgi:hypothetical protein